MITRKVGRTLQSWLFVSIVALVFSFIYRILALISLKNETHNSEIEIIEETQADISAVTTSTAVWNFCLLKVVIQNVFYSIVKVRYLLSFFYFTFIRFISAPIQNKMIWHERHKRFIHNGNVRYWTQVTTFKKFDCMLRITWI